MSDTTLVCLVIAIGVGVIASFVALLERGRRTSAKTGKPSRILPIIGIVVGLASAALTIGLLLASGKLSLKLTAAAVLFLAFGVVSLRSQPKA